MKRLRYWPDVLYLVAVLAVMLALAWRVPAAGPYGYDEADYLRAAQCGWVANWTDAGALPFSQFVRLGASRGRDTAARTELSRQIRARGDALFLRHWHGPLHSYVLLAFSPLAGSEPRMRRAMVVVLALTLLLLYVEIRVLLPGDAGRAAAMLAGVLFAFSYANIRSAVAVIPHVFLNLLCLAAVFCLARMLDSGRLRYWFAAAALLGLAAATHQMAFVLAITTALLGCMERGGVFAGWRAREFLRLGAQSLAVAAGAVLLVWPAAALKLSFATAYAVMGYLALFRSDAAWGQAGLLEAWRLRILAAPAEWTLIAAGLAVFALRRWKERRLAAPAAVFGIVMLVATLRASSITAAQYAVLYLGALHVAAAMSLAPLARRVKPALRYGLIAVAGGALAWSASMQIDGMSAERGRQEWRIIHAARNAGLARSRLLVPQGSVPQLQFYLRDAKIRGYADPAEARRLQPEFDAVLAPGGTWTRLDGRGQSAETPLAIPETR